MQLWIRMRNSKPNLLNKLKLQSLFVLVTFRFLQNWNNWIQKSTRIGGVRTVFNSGGRVHKFLPQLWREVDKCYKTWGEALIVFFLYPMMNNFQAQFQLAEKYFWTNSRLHRMLKGADPILFMVKQIIYCF